MTEETGTIWEDLILAILSTNNYSLEKTYSAIDTLRREKLFDPQNLVRWTSEEIRVRLRRGGYDRGDFMTRLFADRLASLGQFVKSVGVEECERVLQKGKTSEVSKLLLTVKGIGPKVLESFYLLRTDTGTSAKPR
jgi:endonuclease III-like uncharacterized protein